MTEVPRVVINSTTAYRRFTLNVIIVSYYGPLQLKLISDKAVDSETIQVLSIGISVLLTPQF